MDKVKDSEFRLYPYIESLLRGLGWNTSSPNKDKGGQVYTQNEIYYNPRLRSALGNHKPEYTIAIESDVYWVIEAKNATNLLDKATRQGKKYAELINKSNQSISCKMVTAVAGNKDETHYIKTYYLLGDQWKQLQINNRESTGFITPQQARRILSLDQAKLDSYEIEDNLFSTRIYEINEFLHEGAINKRNRAGTLACLLLALANDPSMKISPSPNVLIKDINTRARQELKKYKKDNFFSQIEIELPSSDDNHIKHKNALTRSIEVLRDLNIASTINSGRDVLGQCYEQFLKYANDAKEIGIVLTPRHITTFGAECINVEKEDIILDPTCGTGGFLVAALDKVRKETGEVNDFKKGNIYGIEQDPLVATLAIVNMVFRGDGSSNIVEGNCFTREVNYRKDRKPTKVLMNPPFALKDPEYSFVDRALKDIEKGGLIFAILPISTMTSSNTRGEQHMWRKNLLMRHSLIAVVKLPEDLFIPVMKGTYGVIIKAHIPHNKQSKVIFAWLKDGFKRTKTQQEDNAENNIDSIRKAIQDFISSGITPEYRPREIDCSRIIDTSDLSPEKHIGHGRVNPINPIDDVNKVCESMELGKLHLKYRKPQYPEKKEKDTKTKSFALTDFFQNVERGRSGRNKKLPPGDLPLISTSEYNNGISSMVDRREVSKIYQDTITISSNGSSCYAHYHEYEFGANQDVFVADMKEKYKNKNFCVFLCASINNQNWRFGYYRKFSGDKLKALTIDMPADKNDEPDFQFVKNTVIKIMDHYRIN